MGSSSRGGGSFGRDGTEGTWRIMVFVAPSISFSAVGASDSADVGLFLSFGCLRSSRQGLTIAPKLHKRVFQRNQMTFREREIDVDAGVKTK